jgi:coproporphyrinogen III oxidase-like Fe-S oxidoreductase
MSASGLATVAAAKPADYIARVAQAGLGLESQDTLTPREAAEERTLGGLRILEGVPRAELAALELAPERIEDLVELGLLADDPQRLRATRAGRLVLDRLTAELLA